MNIIFGTDLEQLRERFVVLELDTFRTAHSEPRTVYCLVESIPVQDFPILESYIKAHHDLMQAYRDQNWEYCRHAIGGLHGRWNGELDTFYDDLARRVQYYELNPPEQGWDGTRITSFLEQSDRHDSRP